MEEKAAWLVFMIAMNAIIALVYFFATDTIAENFPGEVPYSIILLLGLMSILNVVFAIYLLKWKKWAFFGFVSTAAIAFVPIIPSSFLR